MAVWLQAWGFLGLQGLWTRGLMREDQEVKDLELKGPSSLRFRVQGRLLKASDLPTEGPALQDHVAAVGHLLRVQESLS